MSQRRLTQCKATESVREATAFRGPQFPEGARVVGATEPARTRPCRYGLTPRLQALESRLQAQTPAGSPARSARTVLDARVRREFPKVAAHSLAISIWASRVGRVGPAGRRGTGSTQSILSIGITDSEVQMRAIRGSPLSADAHKSGSGSGSSPHGRDRWARARWRDLLEDPRDRFDSGAPGIDRPGAHLVRLAGGLPDGSHHISRADSGCFMTTTS